MTDLPDNAIDLGEYEGKEHVFPGQHDNLCIDDFDRYEPGSGFRYRIFAVPVEPEPETVQERLSVRDSPSVGAPRERHRLRP